MTETIEISFKKEIKRKDISDLLITAFEGGVGYWCCITGHKKPDGNVPPDLSDVENWPHAWYPLLEGGEIHLDEEYDGKMVKKHVLDLTRIRLGLALMANKYPRHFADFIDENYDATTADVFLQCCVLGDIVYG